MAFASVIPIRIRADISIDGIFVRDDTGLTTTVDRIVQTDEEGDFVFDEQESIQLVDPDKVRTIVKITRDNNLISYGYLTNPHGEFLSVGNFHVLGSYAQAINSTTNQLLDAGTLANMPTGWLAKNFRKRMGNIKMKPGSLNQTNLSPQDLQTGILMNTFKEPSATLFSLNQSLTADAQRLSSTTDLGSVLGTNTPAATTLSLVQEQQQAVGAIILRIYRSMTREFSIWYKLNAKFMDPELYAVLVDDEEANPLADFNTQDMDIIPAANPRNSSKMQRIQRAQAELSIIDQIGQTGGDTKEVVESYLEAIGSENVDKVYPELSEEQQQAAQKEQERLKQRREELEFLPVKAQADLGEAEKENAVTRRIEAEIKMMKARVDMGLTAAKTDTERAKEKLTVEQTETESTKNATSIVSTELDIEKARREAELANIDRGQTNANNAQPGAGVVQPPSNQ